jgi:outer membrane protein assembly factor BamC
LYQRLSVAGFLIVALLVAGCSSSGSKSGINYKDSEVLAPLEVPPELTLPDNRDTMHIPGAATGSEAASDQDTTGEGTAVLVSRQNARIRRDGTLRWLEVDMPAEQLWPKLRKFWEQIGLELKLDDPEIGIMETQWAENRADITEGFLRGWISKLSPGRYSVPTRDKYRIRLEPLEENTTELFLTHYGAEQTTEGNTDLQQAVWIKRPSDPELSNEVLNRLLVFLGIPREEAEKLVAADAEPSPPTRAIIEKDSDGWPYLVLHENYARAWRYTGIVLDRLGVVVEDQNRSEGLYYVDYNNLGKDGSDGDKSWFRKLFSSDDENGTEKKLTIVLKRRGEVTHIALEGKGSEALTSSRAEEILKYLRDGLL